MNSNSITFYFKRYPFIVYDRIFLLDKMWEKSQFYTAHYKPRWFHFRLLETKVIPIYHPKGFYSLYNHAQAPSGRAAPPKTFFSFFTFSTFKWRFGHVKIDLNRKSSHFLWRLTKQTKDAGKRTDDRADWMEIQGMSHTALRV